jgi:hypothetical protein
MPASFVVLPCEARSERQGLFAEWGSLYERTAADLDQSVSLAGPLAQVLGDGSRNRVMPPSAIRLTCVVSELRDDETAPTPIAVVSGPFGMNGHRWAWSPLVATP